MKFLQKILGKEFRKIERSSGAPTAKKQNIFTSLVPFFKESWYHFWESVSVNDDSDKLIKDWNQNKNTEGIIDE